MCQARLLFGRDTSSSSRLSHLREFELETQDSGLRRRASSIRTCPTSRRRDLLRVHGSTALPGTWTVEIQQAWWGSRHSTQDSCSFAARTAKMPPGMGSRRMQCSDSYKLDRSANICSNTEELFCS